MGTTKDTDMLLCEYERITWDTMIHFLELAWRRRWAKTLTSMDKLLGPTKAVVTRSLESIPHWQLGQFTKQAISETWLMLPSPYQTCCSICSNIVTKRHSCWPNSHS
jgi:hypothetical protein